VLAIETFLLMITMMITMMTKRNPVVWRFEAPGGAQLNSAFLC
jgi:hypothetical protein